MTHFENLLSFFFLVFLLASLTAFAKPNRQQNILSEKYPPEKLEQIIQTAAEWHPYPTVSDRAGWEKIPPETRAAQITRAEQHLDCEWKTATAAVFLEFVRNGNRENFEKISFDRRVQLTELVIGECLENQGRFLDDIVNGIWAICEESYWGVPAHLGLQKKGTGLPDVTEPTVDLFAAETGMLLSWTYYLLGEPLDRVSPLIRERIHQEMQRRILEVNLARDDFWWMGLNTERPVNNWNPWICSNWLAGVLLLENDPTRRLQSVGKIMKCLDQFLNPYPSDGGCDEGPSYWSRAAASLFDCLQLLSSASAGQIDIFDEPLIKKMGSYIYQVQIADDFYINFADAGARLSPPPMLVYQFGQKTGDKTMQNFGAYLTQKQNFPQASVTKIFGAFPSMTRVLAGLFALPEILTSTPQPPQTSDTWLPELQLMTARPVAGSTEGLFLAAKGGHNAESHNHNDVGNFIIYTDGLPAVIDVGVETYTAKTFSPRRYEIWTMQSGYHNLPTINGISQQNGAEFKATDVRFQTTGPVVNFSLNLASAYPNAAGIKFWKRTLTFERGKQITLLEDYELNQVPETLELSVMTWGAPELVQAGKIRVQAPGAAKSKGAIQIQFDPRKLEVVIEPIAITDDKLHAVWGEKVHRLKFSVQNPVKKDWIKLIFK
jgi:hypothetical protein